MRRADKVSGTRGDSYGNVPRALLDIRPVGARIWDFALGLRKDGQGVAYPMLSLLFDQGIDCGGTGHDDQIIKRIRRK